MNVNILLFFYRENWDLREAIGCMAQFPKLDPLNEKFHTIMRVFECIGMSKEEYKVVRLASIILEREDPRIKRNLARLER